MAAPTRPKNNTPFMARLLPGPHHYLGFSALIFNQEHWRRQNHLGLNSAAPHARRLTGVGVQEETKTMVRKTPPKQAKFDSTSALADEIARERGTRC